MWIDSEAATEPTTNIRRRRLPEVDELDNPDLDETIDPGDLSRDELLQMAPDRQARSFRDLGLDLDLEDEEEDDKGLLDEVPEDDEELERQDLDFIERAKFRKKSQQPSL